MHVEPSFFIKKGTVQINSRKPNTPMTFMFTVSVCKPLTRTADG